jgi:hypothetical protein
MGVPIHTTREEPAMSLDIDALLKATAQVVWDEAEPSDGHLDAVWLSLAVIVPAVTAEIRALHKPVHLTFSWRDGVRAEDPCETCGGKAGGDQECGCWGDVDRTLYCLACSDLSGHTSFHAEHPCPTVRLLDELDGAARGEQS